MTPESLELEIVTPERQLVHEQVDEVELPGRNGYLGILPGHAPLLTELGLGLLRYRRGKVTSFMTILQGYAEVLPDRVIILAEVAERAEEIDVERARQARDRARQRMSQRDADIDWDRAQLALERALVRLQAASKSGAAGAESEHPAP